jgi:hypothetical protein
MVGGHFLQDLIVADTFLVLSRAVLTSYIGVTGLIYRMTQDRPFLEYQARRPPLPGGGDHPRSGHYVRHLRLVSGSHRLETGPVCLGMGDIGFIGYRSPQGAAVL